MISGYAEYLGLPFEAVKREITASLREEPEVEQIETQYYASYKGSGVEIVAGDAGAVNAFHFFGGGRDGFSNFDGPIDGELRMGASREAVRKYLGEPTATGGGERIPVLGEAKSWDKYERGAYEQRFEYSKEGLLELTTIQMLKRRV